MTDPINPTRTRTYEWEDPMIGATQAREMDGLSYLHAMMEGKLPRPPISATLNFILTEASNGLAIFTGEPAEYHYNPIGLVHGGLACTLLDSAMGCAVQTKLSAGVGYTTLDVHINMIRALTKDTGPIRCIGEVIHVGRSTATAQARLLDSKDKLYAHGTTTCMIFRP